jgi:hypothetical protein
LSPGQRPDLPIFGLKGPQFIDEPGLYNARSLGHRPIYERRDFALKIRSVMLKVNPEPDNRAALSPRYRTELTECIKPVCFEAPTVRFSICIGLNACARFDNELICQHEITEDADAEFSRSNEFHSARGATATKLKDLGPWFGAAYE